MRRIVPLLVAMAALATFAVAQELGVAQHEEHGPHLVDAKGFSVYAFVPDGDLQDESACYDQCAENWPPVSAPGTNDAQIPDLQEDLLGSIARTDGTTQMSYGGWPLYYFVRDENAGDTNGQGVNDVWFLVNPEGELIGAEDASPSEGAAPAGGDGAEEGEDAAGDGADAAADGDAPAGGDGAPDGQEDPPPGQPGADDGAAEEGAAEEGAAEEGEDAPAGDQEEEAPADDGEGAAPAGDDAAAGAGGADLSALMSEGGTVYTSQCAGCHGPEGAATQVAHVTAIAGNAGGVDNEGRLVRRILWGGSYMPGFADVLSDREVAAVATYVRNSWGHDFGPITEEVVAEQRQ